LFLIARSLEGFSAIKNAVFDVLMLPAILCAGVATVAVGLFLAAMQQVLHLGHVTDVGCRAMRMVDEPGVLINANMSLHPETPLTALLGLVPLRVTLVIVILG